MDSFLLLLLLLFCLGLKKVESINAMWWFSWSVALFVDIGFVMVWSFFPAEVLVICEKKTSILKSWILGLLASSSYGCFCVISLCHQGVFFFYPVLCFWFLIYFYFSLFFYWTICFLYSGLYLWILELPFCFYQWIRFQRKNNIKKNKRLKIETKPRARKKAYCLFL